MGLEGRDSALSLSVQVAAATNTGTVMAIHFHEEDLPSADIFAPGASIAVDTEAMGLIPGRDRLCLVQLSDGSGDEHLVRFGPESDYAAPNLKALLGDPERLKLYHFARFDVAILRAYLGIMAAPLYCTRTASKLIRTYTDRHGLKELVKEMLGTDLSKQQQTSDWGAPEISDAQREYAASDVRYLHRPSPSPACVPPPTTTRNGSNMARGCPQCDHPGRVVCCVVLGGRTRLPPGSGRGGLRRRRHLAVRGSR